MATTTSRVDILLQIESRLKGLNDAVNAMADADKKARSLGGYLKQGFAIGAGILGLSQITGTLKSLSTQAVSMGSRLTDVREQTRLTIREIQVFGGAMKDAGADSNQLTQMMSAQNTRIQEAAAGAVGYQKVFAGLGLDYQKLAAMRPAEAFEEISRAVAGAEDQQAAMNAVSKIYGEDMGPKLLEVMRRLSSEGFEGMSASIEKTYGIMSDKHAEALDRASDAMERWKNRAIVLVGTVLGEFENTSSIKAFGLNMAAEAARLGGSLLDVLMNTASFVPRAYGVAFAVVADTFASRIKKAIAEMRVLLLEALELLARAPGVSAGFYASISTALGRAENDVRNIQLEPLSWEKMKGDFLQGMSDTSITAGSELGEEAARVLEAKARSIMMDGPGTSVFTGETISDETAAPGVGSVAVPDMSGIGAIDSDALVKVEEQAKAAKSAFDSLIPSTQSVASSIYAMGEGSMTFGQVMMMVQRQVVTSLIGIGIEMVKQSIMRRMLAKTETAEDIALTTARTAPKATEAAAASVGSWGISAVVGKIAALVAIAAITSAIVGGFNTGGTVPGGVSGKDNVLIAAASGEKVIQNGPAQRYGPILDRINSGWDPAAAIADMVPAGPRVEPPNASGRNVSHIVRPDAEEKAGVDVYAYHDMDAMLDAMEASGRMQRIAFDVYRNRRMELI